MERVVTLTIENQVAHLTLNRPSSSNALSRTVARQLLSAVHEIGTSTEVGAVIVTGAGRRFCGGGDLKAMLAAEDRLDYVRQLATELDDAFLALASLDVPVVAGVHGAVAGAGLAVMLSCDVVVAAAGTSFTPAYAGVGLTPDCGLSWLLPRAIGQQRALSFLLCNQPVNEQTALSWGLVVEVVEADQLRLRCEAIARSLADGPTWALGQTKRLVRDSQMQTRERTGRLEADTVTTAASHQAAVTRMARFASGPSS